MVCSWKTRYPRFKTTQTTGTFLRKYPMLHHIKKTLEEPWPINKRNSRCFHSICVTLLQVAHLRNGCWNIILLLLVSLNENSHFYMYCAFSLLCVPQGLNNVIHIDFDYKKEFIYWVDSTRPSGRKINRMRLNGSDLKVPRGLVALTACHMVPCAILPYIHWLYFACLSQLLYLSLLSPVFCKCIWIINIHCKDESSV